MKQEKVDVLKISHTKEAVEKRLIFLFRRKYRVRKRVHRVPKYRESVNEVYAREWVDTGGGD